jgi:uncharacterized damage-inducible protein DinB
MMKRDIPELLEGLRKTPKILSEFIGTIPENKWDVCRGDGFWTIAEHVNHLARVQSMLLDRFNRFMKEEQPEFVPFIPGKDEDKPDTPERVHMAAALEHFGRYRNNQLVLLENAHKSVWQRTAIHPEYDQYSLYILTRHTLMHDYWHMYRMEELWLTKDAFLKKLE